MWTSSQRHAPGRFPPAKEPVSFTGGQEVNRACLEGCGKTRPTGIRSPNGPARSGHMTACLKMLVREFLFHSS
jgi:hypothetical protein